MFHRANAAAAAAAAAAQGPPPAHLSISCSICRASFGFFTRRHHCRACGALCCDACSRQRAQLHGWAFARRLCDPCSQAQPPTAPTPSRAQGGGGGMPGGRRRRWEAAAAGGSGGGAAPTPPGGRRDARFDGPWYPGKCADARPSNHLKPSQPCEARADPALRASAHIPATHVRAAPHLLLADTWASRHRIWRRWWRAA